MTTKEHAPLLPSDGAPIRDASEILTGRWVVLEPVIPEHLDFLYELAMDESNWGWRYGGAVISKRAFLAQLWPLVLCQFVVTTRKSRRRLGHVVAYNANLNAGYVYLGGVSVPQARGRGLMNEGFELLIDYLKSGWRFNRIYCEYPAYNEAQFSRGITGEVREVARLREHSYHAGQYWDKVIVAMPLDTFVKPTKRARDYA